MNNSIYSIDPSVFIWNPEDYEDNKYRYWEMVSSLSSLIEKLKNNNFLISTVLQEQMINDFPANLIPENRNDLWLVYGEIYSFLLNIGSNAIECNNDIIEHLTSDPNQIKDYFKEETKLEVSKLISYFHSNELDSFKYLSFNLLWNETNILETKVVDSKIHQAIIADRGSQLSDYLDSFVLKFEHKSPKHDISIHKDKEKWLSSSFLEKKAFISQLSCIENDESHNKAKTFLENRFDKIFGTRYYSYDTDNHVYIVFRKTLNNIYHGHDEYDIDNIPPEVKSHFKIFKYNW